MSDIYINFEIKFQSIITYSLFLLCPDIYANATSYTYTINMGTAKYIIVYRRSFNTKYQKCIML